MSNFFNLFKSFLSGLSKKERSLFYFSLAFLFLLLFDKVVYSPIAERIQFLSDQIYAQKEMIRKNLLLIEHKDRILAERQKYQDFFSQEDLSREERVAQFLSQIEELAKNSGITLTDINPVEIAQEEGFSTYQLTIECRGSMANMVRFIYTVDESSKPLRTVSAIINPQQRADYTVSSTLVIEKLVIIPDQKEEVL